MVLDNEFRVTAALKTEQRDEGRNSIFRSVSQFGLRFVTRWEKKKWRLIPFGHRCNWIWTWFGLYGSGWIHHASAQICLSSCQIHFIACFRMDLSGSVDVLQIGCHLQEPVWLVNLLPVFIFTVMNSMMLNLQVHHADLGVYVWMPGLGSAIKVSVLLTFNSFTQTIHDNSAW